MATVGVRHTWEGAMPLKFKVETDHESLNRFEFTFDQTEITVGRSATCHIQLPLSTVSSHHLTIVREGAGYLITDVGSTNGTRLGDRPLAPNHYTALNHGDRIILTDVALRVFVLDPDDPSASAEQTGEAVRHMVFEMLRHSAEIDDTAAHLEVLEGPDRGARLTLPSGQRELFIGLAGSLPGEGWALTDPALAGLALPLICQGDAYALHPPADAPLTITIDGHPIEAGALRRLRSGQRLRIGQTTALFFDPLEAWLDKLEDPPQGQQARAAPSPLATFRLQSISPPEPEGALPRLTIDDDFERSNTRRVKRDQIKPKPHTRAGLPLGLGTEPALAEAGRVEEAALRGATSGSWTPTELLLLIVAAMLMIGASVFFLMLFDIL